MFIVTAVISFVTGTMFLVWLGEQVNERGIGNGISLIIFASIVSGLPRAIGQSFEGARQGEINLIVLLSVALLAILAIAFIVWVERAQRRVSVNYAKRQIGNQMAMGQSSHVPLKVNMSGVIPAIFASSIVLFPASISTWFGQSEGFEWLQNIIGFKSWATLVCNSFCGFDSLFLFFYTAIQFPAKDISDNLKRSGGFLPGIRPGDQTEGYIDSVMSRLTV